MKKLLLISLTCVFLLLCISGAQATSLTIGDKIKFTSHGAAVGTIGTAGEFEWISDKGYQWSSFCVELNQHVSQGTLYTVTGLTETTTTGKALTQEAAWLFWNFATNDASFGYGDLTTDETDLQALIWSFQTETNGGTYTAAANFGIWENDALTAVRGGWSNNGRVKVVNLGGYQDQLVLSPVPEPATMILFGIGLLGLAGIGRKKIQK